MKWGGLLKSTFLNFPLSVATPMPIYAYKCATCGHANDVMQKMSDDALTKCPACGADAYAKQITAPNFALKGSGWYVTDFRGGNKPADAAAGSDQSKTSSDGKSDAASPTAPTTPAAPSPAPATSVPAAAVPAASPPASAPSTS